MNASAVPLGSSVEIASGLNKDLGFLLDCNRATYSIKSGNDWHLLFIKAEGSITPKIGATEESPGNEADVVKWTFKLLSEPVDTVKKYYTELNQQPKFLDQQGNPVPYLAIEFGAESPHFEQQAVPDPDSKTRITSTTEVTGWPIMDGVNIWLDYQKNWGQMTWASEVGVHIFPIAYHRILNGTPSTGEIVQCARSDYHFWPVPTIPIWSRKDVPTHIGSGLDTIIPPG